MLLTVANLHKGFGVDQILTGVSFRIDRREKVALVGRNGTGKTTLLKIITGQMESDSGSVQLARGAKIGYLRQEAPVDNSHTVLEEAEQARAETLALKARLEALELRLDAGPTDAELEEYATLHEHYMEVEGYSAERDMRTVLQRMGFSEEELDKPASQLSGGEKTRLALARLLLEQPDLLILDEPTNHLDLQATEWLEGWLRSYPGAVLIVSHDRAFLTNVGDRVLEMRDGSVKSYPGPFEKYLRLREEEEERLAEVARKQNEQIAKLDEYVRRFMNSQRTAQARGRLKQMNKLIESRVTVSKADRSMKAGFQTTGRSADNVLICKDLSMGFGDRTLFRGLDWTVRLGERWGVIGENGAGKSTLIRIALGVAEPVAGDAKLGANVAAAYFAQDTVTLNPSQSPLDFLVYEYNLLPAEARNLLGRFLLTGDDVFRPISTLSGGEKNKLVLASLTVLHPNLLVLDEPTNHLDMDSREALANELRQYKGTLILVSHDRWLLEQVTDHTLDLRRDRVVQYPGSYAEYRRASNRPGATVAPKKTMPETRAEAPTMTPRELSKEIERLTRLVAEMEDDIHATEQELKELEGVLEDIPAGADILDLTRNHAHLREMIEGKVAAWTEQAERLEELRGISSTK